MASLSDKMNEFGVSICDLNKTMQQKNSTTTGATTKLELLVLVIKIGRLDQMIYLRWIVFPFFIIV